MLYQHAKFITGESTTVGSLADYDDDNAHLGLLAFIRLVSCSYHKKNLSAFRLNTPEALYHSVVATTNVHVDAHKEWLKTIRVTVWERTIDETYYVPSLELHWKRCVWVLQYWEKARLQNTVMPSPTQYGWYGKDGQLKVHWDTEDNMKKVVDKVDYLTKGCRCKTGCTSKRCKCKKAELHCGPSYQCLNCMNNQQYTSQQADSEQEEVIEELAEARKKDGEDESEDSDEDENDIMELEIDETMNEVFGALFDFLLSMD